MSQIRKAFITKVKRPRVRILMGKVRTIKTGLIRALRTPRSKATIKAVWKLLTLNPGTNWAATRIARAERIQFSRA